METRNFCAYNLTRDASLSSKVTVADAALEPLKVLEVLIGGLGLDSESSLWLTPLSAAPEVPRLFPFDMVYLDGDHRVIQGIEVVPGVDFPPYSSRVASVLILPDRTLFSTHTHPGDQIRVCDDTEMGVERKGISAAPAPAPASETSDAALAEPQFNPRIPIERIPLEVNHGLESLFELFPGPPAAAVQSNGSPADPILKRWIERPADPAAVAQGAESQVEVLETPALSSSHAVPARGAAESPVRSLQNAIDDAPPAIGPVADGGKSTVKDPQAPLVSASSAATPAAPGIDLPAVESGSAPFAVGATPLPAGQSVQFTATQAPSWRVSTPAVATQISRSTETPKSKNTETPESTKETLESRTETPETKSPGKRVSVPDTTSQVKATAKPPIEQVTARLPVAKPPSPPVSIPETSFPGAQNGKPAEQLSRARASAQPFPAEIAPRPESPAKQNSAPSVAFTKSPIAKSTNAARNEVPKLKGFSPRSSRLSPEMLAEVHQLIERQKQKDKEGARLRRNGAETAGSGAGIAEPLKTRKTPQKPKPEVPEKPTLTTRIQHWLDSGIESAIHGPRDRRKSIRHRMPGMVSYHWTGGTPRPHEVADISDTGFYLITEDRWIPETMLRMTLQRPDKTEGNPRHSITVLARVVRIGSDGVGHEFVMTEALNRKSHDILPDRGTDRKALKQFL
jgi:hypothetical protein